MSDEIQELRADLMVSNTTLGLLMVLLVQDGTLSAKSFGVLRATLELPPSPGETQLEGFAPPAPSNIDPRVWDEARQRLATGLRAMAEGFGHSD
jgi:hypothetical protein